MLRRSRLRLVALALVLSALVAGCDLRSIAKNSDVEPTAYAQILDGRLLMRRGDFSAAEAHFRELVEAEPKSWEAQRGLQDALRSRLPEVEFLARYEPTDKSDALSYYLSGRARIADVEEAGELFRRSLKMQPRSPWATAGLAYLAYSRGDLFGAVQTYEEAISRAPRSAKLRLFLGNQFLELKLYVDAQRQLQTALSLAPDDLEVRAALGKALLALGQESEALELLESVHEAQPLIVHIGPSLAAIYLRQGRPGNAEQVYQSAVAGGLAADEELAAEISAALLIQRLEGE